MQVQPYLFFDGRCEEALSFYREAVGAEVQMLMRYSDSPEPPPAGTLPPDSQNKIMHASFRVGDSIMMASDSHCANAPKFEGFSLSISVPDAGRAEQCFNALSEGGKVTMPLAKTFFSESFGMLTDRFGVAWMVIAQPK